MPSTLTMEEQNLNRKQNFLLQSFVRVYKSSDALIPVFAIVSTGVVFHLWMMRISCKSITSKFLYVKAIHLNIDLCA